MGPDSTQYIVARHFQIMLFDWLLLSRSSAHLTTAHAKRVRNLCTHAVPERTRAAPADMTDR